MTQILKDLYHQKIEEEGYQVDPAQLKVVSVLEGLYQNLEKQGSRNHKQKGFSIPFFTSSPKPLAGVYIYGDVGRGKTFLMDQFFESLSITNKKRTHFHSFMKEVHEFIHAQRGKNNLNQAIPDFAMNIAQENSLLCFDEFFVTDIVDAMILKKIFTALWEQGISIVCTSNWPPERLYENGLKRELFLPFIDILKERMVVVSLAGSIDYRMQSLQNIDTYFYPLGLDTSNRVENIFKKLTKGKDIKSQEIIIKKHKLFIPRTSGEIAWFEYKDLVQKAYSAIDFLALSDQFKIIFLVDIPKISADNRDEAKRFMTLIDVLYERQIKVVMSAQTKPEDIYEKGIVAFEFSRTVSRLQEMHSTSYW